MNSVIIALIENFDHKQPLPTNAQIETVARELGVELTAYDLRKVVAIMYLYQKTLDLLHKEIIERGPEEMLVTKALVWGRIAICMEDINAIRKAKEPTEANRDIDPARHIH